MSRKSTFKVCVLSWKIFVWHMILNLSSYLQEFFKFDTITTSYKQLLPYISGRVYALLMVTNIWSDFWSIQLWCWLNWIWQSKCCIMSGGIGKIDSGSNFKQNGFHDNCEKYTYYSYTKTLGEKVVISRHEAPFGDYPYCICLWGLKAEWLVGLFSMYCMHYLCLLCFLVNLWCHLLTLEKIYCMRMSLVGNCG